MSTVRPLTSSDREPWFRLWQGYLDFYETALDPLVSEATWQRLLDPREPMHGLVVVGSDGRVTGILNYILHANTWTTRPVCYLEDLYVASEARGQGMGRAMIEALISDARDARWHRIYWMTKRDNATARKLYDRLTQATDWVRYDVNL